MANVTINDLTARTSLAATDVFEVDNTSSADASEKATFALAGGLVATTGSDADTTMAVGTLYRVDMSAWATATRTYRLPSTAQVGERIGVYITAGNASHELAIRTVAASNDTINGTDYDSADWSKLFITGEIVIFRCVVANTDWIVEHDGRIPCECALRLSTDQTNISAATFTQVNLDASDIDVGDLGDVTTFDITIRRAGNYNVFLLGAVSGGSDGIGIGTVYVNGSEAYRAGRAATHTSTSAIGVSGAGTLAFAVGDVIELYVWGKPGTLTAPGGAASSPTANRLMVTEVLQP